MVKMSPMKDTSSGKKAYTVSIRIEPELYEVIEHIAKEEDRTFSQVLRRIVRKWVAEQELKTGKMVGGGEKKEGQTVKKKYLKGA